MGASSVLFVGHQLATRPGGFGDRKGRRAVTKSSLGNAHTLNIYIHTYTAYSIYIYMYMHYICVYIYMYVYIHIYIYIYIIIYYNII